MKQKLIHYLQLMRFDKPIGILLLLWPTLWALWVASDGVPNYKILTVFVLGVILMRAAGCVINDFADRKLDGFVKRTHKRPLAAGLVSAKEAIALFVGLCLIAFTLVLFLNRFTVLLSFVAVLFAFLYPFAKRFTYLPQFVLGLTFYWGVPMAFAAVNNSIPMIAWLIYLIGVLWAVAYDTMYAMVDREDDLEIGIKSTAVLFGNADRFVIGLLQVIILALLIWLGQLLIMGWIYHASILLVALLFSYQQYLIRHQRPQQCFQAFLNNNWVGLIIFIGFLTLGH